MDKIIFGEFRAIEDGRVAVLYSPSYGSGWYTAHYVKELLFDPVIVEKILRESSRPPWESVSLEAQQEIVEYCQRKYPDVNAALLLGVDSLQVEWLPVGAEFRVDEYDGNETVVMKSQYEWIIA